MTNERRYSAEFILSNTTYLNSQSCGISKTLQRANTNLITPCSESIFKINLGTDKKNFINKSKRKEKKDNPSEDLIPKFRRFNISNETTKDTYHTKSQMKNRRERSHETIEILLKQAGIVGKSTYERNSLKTPLNKKCLSTVGTSKSRKEKDQGLNSPFLTTLIRRNSNGNQLRKRNDLLKKIKAELLEKNKIIQKMLIEKDIMELTIKGLKHKLHEKDNFKDCNKSQIKINNRVIQNLIKKANDKNSLIINAPIKTIKISKTESKFKQELNLLKKRILKVVEYTKEKEREVDLLKTELQTVIATKVV